jgi:hypothetical protein
MTHETNRCFVTCWPGNDVDDRIDLSPAVLSFSATNSTSGQPGTFSVQVSAGHGRRWHHGRPTDVSDLKRVIRPNAVIAIGYRKPGGITMGLVRSVSEQMTMTGGQISRTYIISGESMGCMLTQDEIVVGQIIGPESARFRDQIAQVVGPGNPILMLFPSEIGEVTDEQGRVTQALPGVGVQYMIDWVLDNCPTMRLPLMESVYGDAHPGAWILTDDSVVTWNGARIWNDQLSAYSGNVMGFIRACVDHDFYEIFIDTVATDSDVPDVRLIVRPKPFDSPNLEWKTTPVQEQTGLRWEDLRCRVSGDENHVIPLDQVFACSLGVSTDVVYTWYEVTCDFEPMYNSEAVAMGLRYPLVDLYLLQRYGVRPYSARLALLGADIVRKAEDSQVYNGETIDEVKEFRNRLVNWHRWSPWMLEGSVQVPMSDDYRPGDPVLLPWAQASVGDELGVRFYCTAVSWSWSIRGTPTCTLTLTRGWNQGMADEVREIIRKNANVSARDYTFESASGAFAFRNSLGEVTITPNREMLVSA